MGWTNWSGNQTVSMAQVLFPRTEDELRNIVQDSTGPLRMVGAGHSFAPILAGAEKIVSLDNMEVSAPLVNVGQATATVNAGVRLKELSIQLEKHRVAFRNLGDINVQSLAGATATATHGTGETFGCLSSDITAVRMMKADGSIVEASSDTDCDLMNAVKVSLGSLGILLDATIRVCPSYNLQRRTFVEPIGKILEEASERWRKHRNYEFFYIPFSGYGINIIHDISNEPDTDREPPEDEEALATIRLLRDRLKWNKYLRKRLLQAGLKGLKSENVVGPSWKLLASPRNIKFNEMEYHLPVDNGLSAFRAVMLYIERKCSDVFFPIEVRKTAGDDAWISPFQGDARISVAVHAAADEDHRWFFTGIEPILREAGGRPHWGKLHSLEHDELASLYPDFYKFTEMRKTLDPDGRFLTAPLARYWA